jgi:Na+-translocating ferredoxin:NAD+ oxidoreductase RnfE subunit
VYILKLYIKFAAKYALKMGGALFAVTMSIAIVSSLLKGSDDPVSVVIQRLLLASVVVFFIFYVGSFVYGLYKYYIESPFMESQD